MGNLRMINFFTNGGPWTEFYQLDAKFQFIHNIIGCNDPGGEIRSVYLWEGNNGPENIFFNAMVNR